MHVRLLANPKSGAGAALAAADEIVGLVRARGHDVELVETHDAEHTREAALATGTDRILAAGGDGMFHYVLQGVAGTTRPVGLVPVGTGNDFARALDLPLDDLPAAVEVALGPVSALDAVRTEVGWFATVATLGFSAQVNARGNDMRWPKGSLRYTIATLVELPRSQPITVEIEVDGQGTRVEAMFVAMANTPFFGGGMAICPDARPDDGLLDIGIVGAVGRLELVRLLPKVFSGEHVNHPRFTLVRGRQVTVRSAHSVRADGEVLADSPVTMEVVPGALLFATP
ncbi:MAG: diacylglycerol kinase family lipid kinase [Actinomycetia bacterium]|nr:diacylglycerol kinase family lipid kinase [Actinomycetes bacterium]